MFKFKWFNLQLFAGEGAGDGGGEGAATGETAADPGQQRLLELGVPAEKLRRRAKNAPPKLPEGAVKTAPEQNTGSNAQAAAAENPTEDPKPDDQPKKPSFDELMKDPEYNRQMQAVVQARLRSAKGAEETLGKLAPALELLARHHGMDPAKPDYDALVKAISDDKSLYEKKALEMGVSTETAMKIDQQERETARQQRQQQMTLEQQKFQQHIASLEQQAEKMKAVFPNFDLRQELKNPAFARMTSPNVGISVEDAYHAIHRKEIQQATAQAAVQQTRKKIANAIQSGSYRPNENGTTGQAPSVTKFDYSKASPEQRKALKAQIYAAAAQGKKLYPGG